MTAKKLNLSLGEFEVEVESPESRAKPILDIFNKVSRLWDSGLKIQAIKELRTLATGYGLWEAKTVMENLPKAIALAKEHGTWPIPTRSESDTVISWTFKAS